MEQEPAPPDAGMTDPATGSDDTSPQAVGSRSEPAARPEYLQEIEHCLSALRDLFEGQIARNKSHQEAFDKLYRELEGYKGSFLLEAIHKPIVHNLIRLYDSFLRLESQLRSIPNSKTEHGLLQFSTNMENFRFQLKEVLARMDVESYEDHLDVSARERLHRLDRKLHKPIDVKPTRDPEQDNLVTSVHKHGFYWRGKVVRPEEVTILRHTPLANRGGGQVDG